MARVSTLAVGDRLKFLRKLLEFLRGLNLDTGELLRLFKLAMDLFQDFSVEKLLAFIEALLAAVGEPTSPSAVKALDARSADLFSLLHDLSDLA